uniref:Uncharacterized protein n=1 Tax=Ditylenchus dipsaci TaxID=166011 RepID=A0A915CTM1_9BILA
MVWYYPGRALREEVHLGFTVMRCHQSSAVFLLQFLWTSVLRNCLKRENNVNSTPATDQILVKCAPEIQMFFRSPRDLATQYSQNMKSVLDFQSQHRASLQKHNNEKATKAMKIERSFAAERKKLKSEIEKQVEHSKAIESLLAERDLELHQMRQKLASSSKSGRASNMFPSLNGATPIHTLSFLGCATSTPINNDMDLFNNRPTGRGRSGDRAGLDGVNQFQDIFAMRGELESPIAGAGFMNTPAMLGISQRHQNPEAKQWWQLFLSMSMELRRPSKSN